MTETEAKQIVLYRFPHARVTLGNYGYWCVKTYSKGPGYLFCAGKTPAEAWVGSARIVEWMLYRR